MSRIDPTDPRYAAGLAMVGAAVALGAWWWQISASAIGQGKANTLAHTARPMATEPLPAPIPDTDRAMLAPAARDPFWVTPPVAAPLAAPIAPTGSRQAKPPAAPLPPVQASPEPAPAPPQPPPLDLRFSGRMQTPEGQMLVFATQGSKAVTLTKGTVLPNGYVVKSVSDTAITLEYTALRTEAKFDLPPLPPYELR